MKIVSRYLAREVLLAVGLVISALLALYVFFDFIAELNDVGKNGYRVEHAAILVLLEIPTRAYELLPIAALIGTITALSQLASYSEFTVLRVAGLSSFDAARMVLLPGLVLVAATYLLGEAVAPRAEELTQKLRIKVTDNAVRGFRTGVWLKDTVSAKAPAEAGAADARRAGSAPDPSGVSPAPSTNTRIRFINVRKVEADHALSLLTIYEFDSALRLQNVIEAQSGEYVGQGQWRLHKVVETRFSTVADSNVIGGSDGNIPNRIALTRLDEEMWRSDLNPDLINVLQISPDRLAARKLDAYIRHLEENRQKTERYEIAFWKKLIYPLAVLVMMALALPFAYLHVRSGGVSFKIFTGVMIGIGFYLLNSLFSHLGLLNTWPPFLTAALPSIAALIAALVALHWVERH